VTDSPFWRFSLRFYALEDVAPACLALQDEGGADVNVLLFLLYLAEERSLVTAADIDRLDATIAPWREEAVKPLRALRRRLKTGIGGIPLAAAESFRNQIKKVELEAERLEQAVLEREAARLRLARAQTREEAAEANLSAYGAFLGGLPDNLLKIVLRTFTISPP
jgi:uncharacterized protein (TIGR02444 family)